MLNWSHTPLKTAVFSCAVVASSSATAAQVEGMRLGIEEGKTRLVFDLSDSVTYSLDTLDNPPRIVIKIDQSDIDPTAKLALDGTPIEAIHQSATDSGGLNVTLDLNRQVNAKGFTLAPYLTRGDRLVIDLYDIPTNAPNTEPTAPDTLVEKLAPALEPGPEQQKIVRASSATASQQETLTKPGPNSTNQVGTRWEFGGTWEHEWAYRTQNSGTQKFESLIEPHISISFDSGSELVAIARIRLDSSGNLGPSASRPNNYSDINGPIYNSENAEISLRELYLDTEWAGIYWRLGKQQVVWGQADGIKVLDVVNPQSFREFILDDFDDSRIPLWMINAEIPMAGGDLQLLWIPDTSYHELAELDSPYFLTSPKWIPTITPGTGIQLLPSDKPDDPLKDSDVGLRYSTFAGGWDFTLNYLYHYQDYPVLYQRLESDSVGDTLFIEPGYERNHLIGGTASSAFKSFTLRTELGYNTDTYHMSSSTHTNGVRKSAEFASVVGLDWQYSGSGLLSTQWFLSYLPDYRRDMVRDESENTLSLLFQQGFANDSWQLRVVGLYSLNDEDTMVQLKLKYWLLSNLEVWFGADVFSGTKRGAFGQFNDQDRVLLGLEYGF